MDLYAPPAIGGPIAGATAGSVLFAGTGGLFAQDNANLAWDDGADTLRLGSGALLGWSTDLFLRRGAAGVLEQRDGANAQALRVYGNYTDGSNYERFSIKTQAGSTEIEQTRAGSGTYRGIKFLTHGGAAGSFHLDPSASFRAFKVRDDAAMGWSSNGNPDDTADVLLWRDAAATLALRNSTNPQTLNVYKTRVDGSNYARLAMYGGVGNAFVVETQVTGSPTGCVMYVGTTTAHSLYLQTNALTRWEVTSAGHLAAAGNLNVWNGTSALSTSATAGFLGVNSCAGVPTGTPASVPTGQVPLVVDSTNSRLYAYVGGAWRWSALWSATMALSFPLAQGGAGTTQIAAASASNKHKIVGGIVTLNAAGTIKFTDSDGDLTGAMDVAANSGFVIPASVVAMIETSAVNKAISIVTTGGAAKGVIRYLTEP